VSIVERALGKIREERAAEHKAAAAVAPPSRMEVAVAPTVPPAIVPAHSLTLDPIALRSTGLLPAEQFDRRVRDDYRRIKWPLLEVAQGRGTTRIERANLLMVTSAEPGEGKSFTTMNLALAFAAESDCSVLLVDGDLARPKISAALGLENERGLTDFLKDPKLSLSDVVFATDRRGLSLLPAGRPDSHAPELLAGQRMETIMAEFASRPQSLVLFDTPPLLATNEAQVISRLVGQVVVVVKADETSRTAVKNAIELISKTAAVGVVLNQSKSLFGAPHYGDYYGYNRA